ncbi:MAG: patatin, partial [Bacteroidetes bacterium]
NLRYNFDYFIDKGYYWSLGLNSNYNSFDENVSIDFIAFNDINPENTELNSLNFEYGELTNQFYLQTFFKRIFLLGIGAEHKWKDYQSKTIGIDEDDIPRTVFEDTNYFGAFGFIEFDTLDNKFFPTNGLYFRGDFNFYLFANGLNENFNEFSVGRAKIGYAHPIFDNFSGLIEAEGGVKFGGDETESFDFLIGGYGYKETSNLVSLYGYDDLSFRGDTFLKATLTLDYKLFKKSHINIAANIANIGDGLFDNTQWIDGVDLTGYVIGCGWETFIGPIEAKYSYSPERGEGSWYFSIGYPF